MVQEKKMINSIKDELFALFIQFYNVNKDCRLPELLMKLKSNGFRILLKCTSDLNNNTTPVRKHLTYRDLVNDNNILEAIGAEKKYAIRKELYEHAVRMHSLERIIIKEDADNKKTLEAFLNFKLYLECHISLNENEVIIYLKTNLPWFYENIRGVIDPGN